MSTDAPALADIAAQGSRTRPSLPPVGTYLRAVTALGIGSMRSSLPALAFVYFYHLGTGLYLAFSAEGDGFQDPRAMMEMAMQAIASLPLLLLIYAPLLPLQDAILRGRRPSFSESMRLALRRSVPLVVSIFAQVLILIGPPLLLLGGVGLFVRSLPSLPGTTADVVRAAGFLALIPCGVYVLVMALLLAFAQPAVILESRGPLASIRASFALAASHFGGVFGRFVVYTVALLFATIAVSLPIAFLQATTMLSGFVHPAIKVANVIWEAAVSAASFPFSVAAVLILYRSLRPAGSGMAAEGAPSADPDAPRRATSPFQFE